MAFQKKIFKDEGLATSTDPRIDAKFLNDLQDSVVGSENKISSVETNIADSGWVEMSLLNGWKNYGDPFSRCAYRKIGKQVFIRGMAAGNAATKGIITQLPFKPTATEPFSVTYGTSANAYPLRVDIDKSGNVTFVGTVPVLFVPLSGISFFID